MARKRNAVRSRNQKVVLREDVRKAIEQVWPEGVVDMTFDPEESYFHRLMPRLERAFLRINGARLVHERAAKGNSIWDEAADPEEDPPAYTENSRSYHLFFVCPEGEAFTYETETEIIDEEALADQFEEGSWESEPMVTVPGRGWIGCALAISLLAPFAVISLNDRSVFEDGSSTEPEIELNIENEDGDSVHQEEHFRELIGEKAFAILQALRGKISAILEKLGIAVLPEEEWRKPVSWLKGGEEAFVGTHGEPIRVLEAFFFEGL